MPDEVVETKARLGRKRHSSNPRFAPQEERRARFEAERVANIQDWMDVVDVSKLAPETEADRALRKAVRRPRTAA